LICDKNIPNENGNKYIAIILILLYFPTDILIKQKQKKNRRLYILKFDINIYNMGYIRYKMMIKDMNHHVAL
jgi:hypothetical protein